MSYGPDLARFEVFTVTRNQFFEDYRKTNISYEDYYGVFGVPGFHYSLCRSRKEIERYGKSKVYVRLFTKKSLEKMRDDLFEKVIEKMKGHFDLSIQNVMDDDLVIVAVDSVDSSMINDNSFSLFFAPGKKRERSDN